MRIIAPTVIAMLMASGFAWAGDVMLYEKAPSVEELQRQLTGNAAGDRKKIRTRAIVFGESGAPQGGEPAPAAQQPAPQVYQQPAPQAYQQPAPQAYQQPAPQAYQQPAPQAAAPSQGSMQVGDRAIAFPINFRVNSSEILPESVPFIESIAGLLQKDPGMRLMIEGHTDSSGNPGRNTVLSRERAFSVMNYLVDRYRVDPMRLVPIGKGSSEPLGGAEPTNPKNRRVQFRIVG